MRAHKNVNEKSAAYISVTFKSKDGNEVVPSSARYRLDDVSRGVRCSETIVDWTDMEDLDTTVELVVTADQNSIRNSGNASEFKQLTVEATGVDGEPWRDVYTYQVVNLAGTS